MATFDHEVRKGFKACKRHGNSQGVTLREAANMPCTRPGACLCMSAEIAYCFQMSIMVVLREESSRWITCGPYILLVSGLPQQNPCRRL